MNTFLEDVANDLFEKLDGDFSKVAMVFPNKRAGLFFNEYLAKRKGEPMWAPDYITISELFASLSDLKVADPILLVCLLHRIFVDKTGSDETLDSFYPWGQLLIKDFDNVDKNLVDADSLFRNMTELNEIGDDLSFLDEEQVKALQHFFHDFSLERASMLKQRFNESWNHLNVIYHSYKEALTTEKIAYEGMLERDVIEEMNPAQLPYDKYVFVGFNVLNKVEVAFFEKLKEAGKALFYWDYDVTYCPARLNKETFEHEAGTFIRQDIARFGNELGEEHYHHLEKPKDFCFIASPTDNAQARYLSKWAKHLEGEERENAVVLCNESLLLPVLHSIPEEVKEVNITMGFPLSETPVFSLLKAVTNLQSDGFDSQRGMYKFESINIVLSHLYVQRLSGEALSLLLSLKKKKCLFAEPSSLMKDDFLSMLFARTKGNKEFCQYLINILKETASLFRRKGKGKDDYYGQLYQESIYQCFVTVNRLLSLIDKGVLSIEMNTLNGLVNGILGMTNIPFHGEPAVGMQVMGVLETRNLDFKNLLILSMNEGQLPKSGNDTSFIPFSLRKAFGMTTVEHETSVYAYYFYRLIQRAEHVTILYNSNTKGLNKGEMSRFMQQLLVELPQPVRWQYLDADMKPSETQEIVVKKNDDVMRRLVQRFECTDKEKKVLLSPSALNTYMACSLNFYFQYVARLRNSDELKPEIDGALFGSIFHDAAQMAYEEILSGKGKDESILEEDIVRFEKAPMKIEEAVDRSMRRNFFHIEGGDNTAVDYNGIQLINRRILINYLKNLLELDKRYTPFKMVAMEEDKYIVSFFIYGDKEVEVHVGGRVDRIDLKNDIVRVVDYKTGKKASPIKDVDLLFACDSNRDNYKYPFQVMLYASAVKKEYADKTVKPALIFIHKASKEDYSSDVIINKEAAALGDELFDTYMEGLAKLVAEIFNPDIPFKQTTVEKNCDYCDFCTICGRKKKDD
jgi:hypothetical protein